MIKYRVVSCDTKDELEQDVGSLLIDGYRLQGGVSVVVVTTGTRESYLQGSGRVVNSVETLFSQALIKDEEPTDD